MKSFIVGCVALKPVTLSACELKRLYVPPTFQGQGVGLKLTSRVIECCRLRDCQTIYIATLERLTTARALYRRLGFEACSEWPKNPESAVSYLQLKIDIND